MMTTYIDIAQALREAVPSLAWIDLDKEQLETPEQFNSIIVPGVLIDVAKLTWQELGAGFQWGEGIITIKTIVVLPTDTHESNPLLKSNLDMLKIAEEVHEAMIEFPGITKRLSSHQYSVRPFFVSEQQYEAVFKFTRTIKLKPKPAPEITATVKLPIS